jgi:pimeloyl-ACP methyl ester carboxylesterase
MPDFPARHIVLAHAHKLSDPNPQARRFPDRTIDWGMDARSPRVGWYLQNAKDGTLWDKLLPGQSRIAFDPYEHRTTVPTFFIHGTEDYTLPPSFSRAMLVQLQNWGVECGMVEAPGQGHGFDTLTEETDPEWEYIYPGLQFLERHAFAQEDRENQ